MNRELIAYLDAKLNGFANRIDSRLDGIDGRLDGIDGRLDGIDVRLDGLDGRLDGIDGRLDGLDGRLDGMDVRLDGIDGRLDGMDGRLDSMDGRLDGLDGRLDELQTQTDRRFDETREQNRHTHILMEEFRSQIQALAEGHAAQDEKIERRFDRAEDARRRDRRHLEGMMNGLFVSLSRRDDEIEKRVGAGGGA